MVTIIETDEDLRHLIYDNQYVSVKYHNDQFRICQELFPQYLRLSEDEKYKKITFVRVNADENLIAKKIIEKDVYSFMAIYKKGLLIESQTISSVEEIEHMLDKLKTIIDPE
jgi:hypothetical protein